MKSKQHGFGLAILIFIFLIVSVVGVAGFIVYQVKYRDKKISSENSKPLMIVTADGGLCAGSCFHSVNNLYDSGKFDKYKKLNSSEVSELRHIINTTDFLKYGSNANPKCGSFVDGEDQVLLFPQKYGNKTFTPCMLDIPENDPAFSFINKLLKSHYIEQK